MRFASVAACLLLLACRRTDTVAKEDPTPPRDAAPEPIPNTHALLHGRIVDVHTGDLVHVLRTKRPRAEALDGRGAFTLDVDDQLRAWDPRTGALRFAVRARGELLAVDSRRAYVAEGAAVVGYDRGSGAPLRFAASSPAPVDELRVVAGHVIARQGGTDLTFFDGDTGAIRTTHHVLGPIEALLEDRGRALIAPPALVCYVVRVPPRHRVECLDLDARSAVSGEVTLGRPTDPPFVSFGLRYASPHHALLGTWTWHGAPRRSAVMRVRDGAVVATIEHEIATLAERADGTLEGMIASTPDIVFFAPSGVARWTYPQPSGAGDYAAAVVVGDRVVVAQFSAIATGVDVSALRLVDGTLAWKGTTKVPAIGHSKYHNVVTLEARGDAVILRGHESAIDHVHVYSAETGALRFSDVQ